MEPLYFWASCKCRDIPKKVPWKSLITSWICLLFSFISWLKKVIALMSWVEGPFLRLAFGFYEASEIQATCALSHTVDFGVLFLRSNLLHTYKKSTIASFFVPAGTLIKPKLFKQRSCHFFIEFHLVKSCPSTKLKIWFRVWISRRIGIRLLIS